MNKKFIHKNDSLKEENFRRKVNLKGKKKKKKEEKNKEKIVEKIANFDNFGTKVIN